MQKGKAKSTAITWKHVWLFLILPVCVSATLFCLAFYLKHQEMKQYLHPGWRLTLLIIAGVTGVLSIFVFWMNAQVSLLRALGIKAKPRKTAASIVINLGTLAVILFLMFTGLRMEQYNDAIEEKALSERGIVTEAVITRFERIKTKQSSHYNVYLKFETGFNKMVEECFEQKQLSFNPGDTVSVVYLAINPDIFRLKE